MDPAPPTAPSFLDVPRLLEDSRPRPRVGLVWYGAVGFIAALVSGALMGRVEGGKQAAQIVGAVLLLGFVGWVSTATVLAVRRLRAESRQVETAAELVQLRHWPQAALVLDQYLSRPTRGPRLRAQALLYLTAVLARYHRFADVIAVQQHLLDHRLVDDVAAYGLRLGRAMAMLREDHLFDADRAIAELRRITPGGAGASGGLALVEIYRDVKTGHPAEAIELFESRLPALRDQLGHRVGDAYALAARAYDLLGREAEASVAYRNATLLIPWGELHRRYPEVEKLTAKYHSAPAPTEAM